MKKIGNLPKEEVALQSLIGKTSFRIFVSKRKDRLIVETINPYAIYTYKTINDCCSESYIESIDHFSGSIIKKVEKIKISSKDGQRGDRFGIIDYWDHRIITKERSFVIRTKTAYNGYYGGSLELDTVFDGKWEMYLNLLMTDSVELSKYGVCNLFDQVEKYLFEEV